MIDEDAIRYRWETVGRHLDERGRRLFAAAEVRTAGWGGLAVVSKITGLARSTINRGEDDIDAGPLPEGRQARRAGGGRKARPASDGPARRGGVDRCHHDQGLKVECVLDERTYEKGIKVSDTEMAALDITGDTFHPERNYTIKPRHR